MSTHNHQDEKELSEWESGALGQSFEHAVVSEIDPVGIDSALNLQSISIRMPLGLLEDLKAIARVRGIGYQPLIKQQLQRFVISETRLIAREYAELLESRKILQKINSEQMNTIGGSNAQTNS